MIQANLLLALLGKQRAEFKVVRPSSSQIIAMNGRQNERRAFLHLIDSRSVNPYSARCPEHGSGRQPPASEQSAHHSREREGQ